MLEPAGNRLFNVEARTFVLEMRKAGVLVDLVPADPATILARLKRGDFDLVPMMWQGAPDEDPTPLYGATARSTTAATVRARSKRCSTRPAAPRGRRRARRS